MKIFVYERYEQIKDIEQVKILIQSQMKVINAVRSIDDIDLALRSTLQKGKRAYLFVCSVENEVIGFVFGNISSGIESGGDYFWMNEVHVKESARKKQVAMTILKYLEEWLRRKKIHHIYGITSKQNEIALRLYSKLGYSEEEMIWIDKYIKSTV